VCQVLTPLSMAKPEHQQLQCTTPCLRLLSVDVLCVMLLQLVALHLQCDAEWLMVSFDLEKWTLLLILHLAFSLLLCNVKKL